MPLSGPLRNNKRSEALRCLAFFSKGRNMKNSIGKFGKDLLIPVGFFSGTMGKRRLCDHDSQSARMHTSRLLTGIGQKGHSVARQLLHGL